MFSHLPATMHSSYEEPVCFTIQTKLRLPLEDMVLAFSTGLKSMKELPLVGSKAAILFNSSNFNGLNGKRLLHFFHLILPSATGRM